MNGFQKQLKIGQIAETAFINHFKQRDELIDVRNDIEYQQKDIDYIIKNKQGETATVEVKADTNFHATGNLFFEIGYDRETGYYDGWFNYCQADYICYYNIPTRKGLILDFQQVKAQMPHLARQIVWDNKCDGCIGYAYLLPIGRAKNFIVYQWEDLEND